MDESQTGSSDPRPRASLAFRSRRESSSSEQWSFDSANVNPSDSPRLETGSATPYQDDSCLAGVKLDLSGIATKFQGDNTDVIAETLHMDSNESSEERLELFELHSPHEHGCSAPGPIKADQNRSMMASATPKSRQAEKPCQVDGVGKLLPSADGSQKSVKATTSDGPTS